MYLLKINENNFPQKSLNLCESQETVTTQNDPQLEHGYYVTSI